MRCASEKLVIVFYGADFGGDCLHDVLASWWGWTDSVCHNLDFEPTHVGGVFRRKPSRMRDNFAYAIQRYRSRFREELAADNITRIDLEVIANPKQYNAFDWILKSMCQHCDCGGCTLFGLDCDAISKWDARTLSGFMRECFLSSSRLRINYGFATIMPRDYIPASYVNGLTTRVAGKRLSYDTTAWRRYAQGECGHLLRNLYGWNILTPEHLAIDVGGTPLKDWISASPKRGKLYEIAAPLWCWTFEDLTEGNEYLNWECEAVESIRQELEGHQLFPWQTIG